MRQRRRGLDEDAYVEERMALHRTLLSGWVIVALLIGLLVLLIALFGPPDELPDYHGGSNYHGRIRPW